MWLTLALRRLVVLALVLVLVLQDFVTLVMTVVGVLQLLLLVMLLQLMQCLLRERGVLLRLRGPCNGRPFREAPLR